MAEENIEFPRGIYFDRPREGAPEFVKGRISLSKDIVDYYNEKKNEKGYVNIDLLVSKGGKLYLKLNDWKPTGDIRDTDKYPKEEINPDDIPF